MSSTTTRASASLYTESAHRARSESFGWRNLTTPIGIAAVIALLLLWLAVLNLDEIETRVLNWDYVLDRTREHVELSVIAAVIVALIAVPCGIAASRTRSRVMRTTILAIANVGQATPAVGLIILLALIWQTGFLTALVAIIAYCFLPILRNTMVGLQEVDANVKESARGMGMTPRQVLFRIELPLAVPVIAAGLRTALVFAVGIATIGVFISAGGLGEIIISGLKLQRFPMLITGAVLVACMALLADWIASIGESLLRPKGL